MSVRLMVLGVMHREKQAHGYRVLHELSAWRADTWTNIRPGSIYHALTQLEKEGLLLHIGSTAGSKGSAKTMYAITDAGEIELKSLVQEALVSYDQEVFTAGLAFMDILSRGAVIELAKERVRMHQETIAFMHSLPRDDAPKTPAKHPAIISSWTALFESTLIWQKQFLADLESGRYTFDRE